MRKPALLLIVTSVLTACQAGNTPVDATPAEINMAEMMDITIEELRSQTPEEHMRMMQEMMESQHQTNNAKEDDTDVMNLPVVQPTEVLTVQDGDTITLNPTRVRKKIGNKWFAMYGYNSQIPGPVIHATQATTIGIDVTNNIDSETTIHWHGIRLDNANDGVPDVTQEAIQPGGTYHYEVRLPDEGIYWYHPHVREDIQQDLGLYGNLLVKPTDSSAYGPVNEEHVLVFDDLLLDNQGNLVPHGEEVTYGLMGRFGNLMLINGSENYEIDVDKGSVHRFYLTNTANTRTFRIRFDGAPMKLVGSDIGRYETEEWVDSITIAPAERYIVDVLFDEERTYHILQDTPLNTYPLGFINVTDDAADPDLHQEFDMLRDNQDVQADIDAFRPYFDKPIDKRLKLSIEMKGRMANMNHGMMMDHTDDGIEWEDTMPGMNEMMGEDDLDWKFIDEDTGLENMDIDWNFETGDIVKVRITNDKDSAHPMQHPIHFHGQRFLVLSMDGTPNDNLVWKDTVLLPTGSTAELLFEISNPGDWMFHCHIAEHLSDGMMGMFHVTES